MRRKAPRVEPTPEQIGARIGEAIDTASDELLPGKPAMKRRRVTIALGISDDTLDRYIKGKGDPSALTVWRIGQMTGQPFAWFAGQEATESERLAVIAERASAQIAEVTGLLDALRMILTEAASRVGPDQAKIADKVSSAADGQRRKQRRKVGTVAGEAG